jgi:uncharacterized protein (DUF934 family)
MPLLKNGAVVSDSWRRIADDVPLPESAPVIVTVARWQADQAVRRHAGPLGLALPNDFDVRPLGTEVHRFDLIALHFPKFTDGRAYTQARLLRERLGFAGELRATGQVLHDQLLLMQRCGFDAFEIGAEAPVAVWEKAMRSFSVFYQPTADGRRPVLSRHEWRRRA